MIKVGAQIILEFGKGDISVNSHVATNKELEEKVGFMTFNQIPGGEIGRNLPNDKNKSVEEIFQDPIVLQFDNKESIDVIIRGLERIKKSLIVEVKPKTLN